MSVAGRHSIGVTIGLQGWVQLPTEDVEVLLDDWRSRGLLTAPADNWWAAQPIDSEEPVGSPERVVTVLLSSEVELAPGSQGWPTADPPGWSVTFVPARNKLLVADARCLLRVSGTVAVEEWEHR